MAELADALDLGSSGRPWGFESLHPHEKVFETDVVSETFFYVLDKRMTGLSMINLSFFFLSIIPLYRFLLLNLIPFNFICFQMKFKAAAVSFVNSCILWFIGIIYYTVFSIFYIGMNFHIKVG